MAVSRLTRLVILPLVVSAFVSAQGADVKQAAQTLTPKQIYAKYSNSVVHIYIENAKGDSYTGTGFFFEDGKQIATCFHVVRGAVKIRIEGTKSGSWEVAWVGWDEKADLALLELTKDSGRTPCVGSDLKEISPGDPVTVVGNPLGFLENSVTVGIVSALRRHGVTYAFFSWPEPP